MIRPARSLPLILLLTFAVAPPSSAQVQVGRPQFGTFGGGPDIINLGNLNSHLELPVLHKNGRGIPFDFNLVYDSSVWSPVTVNGSNIWQPRANWGWGTGGTDIGIVTFTVKVSTIHCVIAGQTFSAQQTTWSNWFYFDGSDTSHPFDGSAVGTGAQCSSSGNDQTTGFSTEASDGSGYILSVPGNCCAIKLGNVTVTSPTANLITPLSKTIQDRNGNQITSDTSGHLTDTLGVVALTTSGAAPNPVSYSYTAPSGATASFTQTFKTYTVQTSFGCSGVSEYGATSNPLVDKITLPDGSFYQFTYELTPGSSTNVTGRLASVRFPTGGTISYQYSGGANGITCLDGSAATFIRTTPDGQWTYSRTLGTFPASSTTITDPQGNQTQMQFVTLGGTTYQTVEHVYQGSLSGTLLRNSTTCYDGMTSNCATSTFGFPISQKATTTQLGASGPQCKHVTFYDGGPGTLNTGVINEQDDYDYGATAPGALMKKTLYTYTYSSPPQVNTIQVQNGGGSTIAQTTFSYDETSLVTPPNQPTPQHTNSLPGPRRNLTTKTYGLTEHWTYFDTGETATHTDTNGAQTSYNYGALTATCGNSFPTTISLPSPNVTIARSYTWNCTGGVQLTSVDENNQTTTTAYTDPYFWRPGSVSFPDNGLTSYTYNSQTSVTTTTKMNSSQNITSVALLDGLGRPIQSQLTSVTPTIYQDTAYDSLGRVYSVSNPYNTSSDATYGLTKYQYDTVGRLTKTTFQDNSASSLSYTDNTVTATDPAGKATKSVFDALGRQTQAFEDPGAAPHLNYETDYAYDALGNLLCVGQKGTNSGSFTNCASIPASWRPRQFTYDGLSRLTSSTTPEGGTVSYNYNSNGDLATKVAPAPNQTGSSTVTTTYSWDTLHRLTQKSYSDGTTPSMFYSYDQNPSWSPGCCTYVVGRVVESKNQYAGTAGKGTSTLNSYDKMGRILFQWEQTPSLAPGGDTFSYTYDLAGNVLTATNGVGVTLTSTYDTAGRFAQLTSSWNDSQHPGTLATMDSTAGYWPSGAVRKIQLGNGLYEITAFNNRLQPCRINTNSTSSYTLSQCTDALPSGNVLDFTYAYNSAGAVDNGNVASWVASGRQTFNRSYVYDSLNRLGSMSSPSDPENCTGYTWTYDAWGSMYNQSGTGGCGFNFAGSIPNAKNQLPGAGGITYQYDAAGNMTYDGSHTYYYDAENRLSQVDGALGTCSSATACYVYDANGFRVRNTVSGNSTDYLHDLNGNTMVQLIGSSANAEWVYLGSQMLAKYADGTTYFLHTDHLGSGRLLTKMDQSTKDSFDYLAFGKLVMAGSSYESHQFTGDEYDWETGLNHTQFRQYSGTLARWMTPDPGDLAAADPSTPQSWNRYSYVLNNPVNLTDPDGLWCVWGDGTHDDTPENGGASTMECEAQGGYWDPGNYFLGFYEDKSGKLVGWDSPDSSGTFAPDQQVTVQDYAPTPELLGKSQWTCAIKVAQKSSVAGALGIDEWPIVGDLLGNSTADTAEMATDAYKAIHGDAAAGARAGLEKLEDREEDKLKERLIGAVPVRNRKIAKALSKGYSPRTNLLKVVAKPLGYGKFLGDSAVFGLAYTYSCSGLAN